jgi:beta-N-acetylhexosaminidase
LEAQDFPPFRALADAPWAMTAHVVYKAIDDRAPATASVRVIDEIIRGIIGFRGVLVSDDLSMKALGGSFESRTQAALDAGCDLVLHCNGDMAEMQGVAAALRPLSEAAQERVALAVRQKRQPQPFDVAAAVNQVDGLLA